MTKWTVRRKILTALGLAVALATVSVIVWALTGSEDPASCIASGRC